MIGTLSTAAQPVEYDKELGKEYSKAVEQQMGIYDNLDVTRFVAGIGEKLVNALGDQPFEYSFKLADTEVTNAFALPGGYTYVTRGLLALINDESELAGVMAHEIIHVDKRHSVQQMNRSGILPGLLRLPGQIVGAFSPAIGSLLLAPADITAAAFSANYSRSHEKESDKLGVVLAANAGYDPHGLTRILNNLSAEVQLQSGEEEKSKLLDDHPITPKRLKYLEKEISRIEGSVQSTSKTSHVLDVLEGMTYGQNPEQGVIIDNRFMHPDMQVFMEYPADWQTTNTPAMVGAVQADGQAMIVLAATDNTQTPKAFCDTIVEQLGTEYSSLIKENKSVEINGYSGQSLILVDNSGTTAVYMQIVWLKVGTDVFQFSALGVDKYREALEKSLFSFRPLTSEERSTIMIQQINIVTAQSGETLEDLATRTRNVLDIEKLSVMNALEANAKLKEGQRIKIVGEKPYIAQ
jgi:predicted Zn-dependent protease